jgi:hypothetical protein
MITATIDGEDVLVEIAGKEAEILGVGDDFVLAQCGFSDLEGETAGHFPELLKLEIRSEDGFGTYFFHELVLSHAPEGVALEFRCHTPNKYWEGRFGLATFLAALRDQVPHTDNWEVTHLELEDDWKGITLQRVIAKGNPIQASILSAATDLNSLLHTAEVALSGLRWTPEHSTDERSFCLEILYPLLRRMGFSLCDIPAAGKSMEKILRFPKQLLLAAIVITACKRRPVTSAVA